MKFQSPTPISVWAEPIEALPFFFETCASKEGQPFDELRANGKGFP